MDAAKARGDALFTTLELDDVQPTIGELRRLLDEAMERQLEELRSQNELLLQRVVNEMRVSMAPVPSFEVDAVVAQERVFGALPVRRAVGNDPAIANAGLGATSDMHSSGAEVRGAKSTDAATDAAGETQMARREDQDKEALAKIETQSAGSAARQDGPVSAFSRGELFRLITGMLIMSDAVLTTVDAHKSAMSPGECEQVLKDVGTVFNAAFGLELILRLCVYKISFFKGAEWRWNVADLIIIFSGIVEEIFSRVSGLCTMGGEDTPLQNLSRAGSLLRILRIVRVVRMVKLFGRQPMFREFRIMVSSVLNCLGPLAWACLLLFFVMWAFGIYFVYLATDYVNIAIAKHGPSALDTEEIKLVRAWYGSIFSAMYMLFACTTGGREWAVADDLLYRFTGEAHATLLWMAFVALVGLAVLNVITGIFVESATRLAMQDRDLLIQEAMSESHQLAQAARLLFGEADADGSGTMTLEELMDFIKDPAVQAYMSSLEFEAGDARRMFDLLDTDGSGRISIDEFVMGCQDLRGTAMKVDIALLSKQIKRLSAVITDDFGVLSQELGSRFFL